MADPDEPTEYASDALEHAENIDAENASAKWQRSNGGRAELERQLSRNDMQIGRENARAFLKRDAEGMRDEMSPEHILQEQNLAAKHQRMFDEHNRNWKPPPGGVPGYAKGGSVKHGSDTVVTCKNKFG